MRTRAFVRRPHSGHSAIGSGRPGGVYSENIAGSRYYFAFDGLGSVVGLFNTSGSLVSSYVAVYEPYGKLVGSTPSGYPSFHYRFAGYWYDADDNNGERTKLYKVGARYYDPDSGRWTQRNPIDNPLESHGWNRYIYAGDDPVNSTDPSGMLNGCGPGIPGGGVVPDMIFRTDCNAHDVCYGSVTTTKSACDAGLVAAMSHSCGVNYSWLSARRFACYGIAASYGAAVAVVGGKFFLAGHLGACRTARRPKGMSRSSCVTWAYVAMHL